MKANSEVTQHAGTDNDQGIISRVRHALQQQPVVSALDLSHINVAVREGNAYLAGHVRSRRPIEETVAGIPDMPGIYSELVDDQELAASVARALASDPRTRSHVFRVYADHGWVRVMGTVPSWEAQEAVEAVIGTQSLVRGVVQLPAIAGEPAPIHRRAVQPPGQGRSDSRGSAPTRSCGRRFLHKREGEDGYRNNVKGRTNDRAEVRSA